MPDPIQSQQTQSQEPGFTDPNAEPKVTAPVESWSKGWTKDDGSFDHKVFEKAPEDLKPLGKELGLYKSIDDLLKSHKGLREVASKKGLFEPLGDKATDAEKADRAAMLRKANRTPDKPEDYGIKRPDAIPEAYWNSEAVSNAVKILHEEGASPDLAKKLFEAQTKLTVGTLENQKKEQAAIFEEQDRVIREALVKEGFDFPKGLEDAKRAARKYGLDPESPFLKNASVFMAMSRAGRNLKEDTLITGATETLASLDNISAAEAGKRAESIARNPKDPLYKAYWNKGEDGKPFDHPEHDSTVALVRKLNARLRTG